MDVVNVSWLAIVIAAVVKFVIGAAWYSPPLLGRQWQADANITPDPAVMPRAMAIQIVGDLVMAYIMARFIGHYAAAGLMTGALVGFMAWIGFVAFVMLGAMTYENRPPRLWLINAGYHLVGMVVMGAIIGAMAPVVVPPPAA